MKFKDKRTSRSTQFKNNRAHGRASRPATRTSGGQQGSRIELPSARSSMHDEDGGREFVVAAGERGRHVIPVSRTVVPGTTTRGGRSSSRSTTDRRSSRSRSYRNSSDRSRRRRGRGRSRSRSPRAGRRETRGRSRRSRRRSEESTSATSSGSERSEGEELDSNDVQYHDDSY